ncbi:MAG: class I SAM-dependent methyltransferase, partial [Candidatus Eisenbacteria sp.]|nr:class I SAM-dependent methyltransferase [Candidatus Eisenbacteria bacterium]
MQRDATPSGIFEWIGQNCRPKAANAQTLRFERMESQAGHKLPEVHLPLDHRDALHWHHRGMIWDYVLSLEDATRVLDVGPGDGWPSLLIAQHFKEVVGIEPGPKRTEACRANARRMHVRNAQFETMSACDMDFRTSSFDGVVAAMSIEQTPNPTAALSEIYRVLKVGGTLRMTHEVLEWIAEPVREVISVQPGIEGSYLVDYVVSWMEKAEEQVFLLEVVPLTDGNKKRLELWAKRCKDDLYPHRDPRLERGLAQTIKSLRKAEILKAQSFKIHHFKSQSLVHTLSRIGFTDIQFIAGGGWPAQQCALEMIRSHRIEA